MLADRPNRPRYIKIYANSVDAWVLGDWVVGMTGEPLPNEIKYLRKSAGKMCSLNLNGYF